MARDKDFSNACRELADRLPRIIERHAVLTAWVADPDSAGGTPTNEFFAKAAYDVAELSDWLAAYTWARHDLGVGE